MDITSESKQIKIDINVDLGEGIGNENDIMPLIASCNIACGGHAGNPALIEEVILLAKKHAVKIGAHPSFPDKQNFGRAAIDISPRKLYETIKNQIDVVYKTAKRFDLRMHHVKPHGALYNLAAKHKSTAKIIVDVIKSFDDPIKLYVPPNSKIAAVALSENIPFCFEAFIDRGYTNNYSLVPRNQPHALLTNIEDIISHSMRMILREKIKTVSGKLLDLKADTFCIHGDNPEVIAILKALTRELKKHNICIQ